MSSNGHVGSGRLPTFLIIGAQKSATRWLRINLGLHPDVYTAPEELEFFNDSNRFETLGVDGYRSCFDGWSGETIVGEATPGYMFWGDGPDGSATRMEQVLPDARLIALLRNPVDRAQSALIHHVAFRALPPDTDLLDYVRSTPPEDDPLGIVSGGWYAASLEPFRHRFGENLLVLLHDDGDDDPRGTYDRALQHVGTTPDFVPRDLDRVRFSNRQGPVGRRKAERELTLDERRELYDFFADDIEQLETQLGRDLSIWAPDQPSC